MKPETEIDFVITWVDGSDPDWLKEKLYWLKKDNEEAWSEWTTGELRFRDWGLLPYWFRGVENFAPWVRKIHFITWGHVPKWLNTNHPKLNIVKHSDYIPSQYLPTFNSHTIELNIHRIKGLSEFFVYFNDDMFLTRRAKPTEFFKNNLPRDYAGLTAAKLSRVATNYRPYHAMIISEHFSKKEVIRKHPLQWLNPLYGPKSILQTITMLPYPDFRGFQRNHLPANFLKNTFEIVWTEEYEELDRSCKDKFRGFYGVSPWLLQDWQRVTGQFIPIRQEPDCVPMPAFFSDRKNSKKLYNLITSSKKLMISLNDNAKTEDDFRFWQHVEQEAFEKLLPQQSEFELYDIWE